MIKAEDLGSPNYDRVMELSELLTQALKFWIQVDHATVLLHQDPGFRDLIKRIIDFYPNHKKVAWDIEGLTPEEIQQFFFTQSEPVPDPFDQFELLKSGKAKAGILWYKTGLATYIPRCYMVAWDRFQKEWELKQKELTVLPDLQELKDEAA